MQPTGSPASAPLTPDDLPAGQALTEIYDVALLDLDGVVYVGREPIPGVPEVLVTVRETGMRLAFVTNNASRRASEVTELLKAMGVPVAVGDVVTSAQAAAHLLRERLAPGSAVLVVGTEALAEEVSGAGLTPVGDADPLPAAVVQGYGPNVGYRDLAEATVAIRSGALWVATNTDSTLPSPRGPLPGNGAMVAALEVATGIEPTVVGKPQPGLLQESIERTGAHHPLVVGDRLDTDIVGAVAVGTDSLLVLSGVTTPALLLAAPSGQRPTYVATDLGGLLQAHPVAAVSDDGASCGGFVARWDGPDMVLSVGGGAIDAERVGDDPLDALRALCAASWAADKPPASVRAADAAAAEALSTLGLGE